MKILIAIFVTALMGAATVFGHEPGEHASTEGLFSLKAEYVHTLLNPIPVYGLALGALSLVLALLARNKTAQVISLILIVLCSAAAWPVLYYGQHGYNHLFPQLDTESQQWLDVHMHRAEQFIYTFYATAILGVATLACFKKFTKAARTLSRVTLLVSLVCVGIGGWISRAGGQASHSESRTQPSPTNTAPQQHQRIHDHQNRPDDLRRCSCARRLREHSRAAGVVCVTPGQSASSLIASAAATTRFARRHEHGDREARHRTGAGTSPRT